MKFKWPLNKNNFTLLDKFKISKFILNSKNRWTQDIQVKNFEKKFAKYVGCKYSVFVSSGSTANELIAQYYKSVSAERNIVVLPSTTWQTSCSPWIKNGFSPHFIDISLDDFSIDKKKLIEFLKKNHEKIACVFPTSLIGFCADFDFYKKIEKDYGVKIAFDNCENTFGEFKNKNISSYFTSSTSTYFGHQIQSIEGGFIFTNSEDEYKFFLINRNHGMVRSLSAYGFDTKDIENKDVDSSFDFYSFGNNYRNSDLNAYIGQLDFNRIPKYTEQRKCLYNIFKENLNNKIFYLPKDRKNSNDSPFCLPIITTDNNKNNFDKAKEICNSFSVETRPIISGFLGYHTCYKKYFNLKSDYKNSIYLHNNGFYIGLYHGLKKEKIKKLIENLNNI
jgi:CDP-4-dehydro-6-deoxyglucose reductase, E1